jgi:hypothetical protein
MQVSQLVSEMKGELRWSTKDVTRERLRDKIAGLTQPQLMRATDALAMIWDGMQGPLGPPPAIEPKLVSSVLPTIPNWYRMKLALLKAISTGVFIDVQFYASNKINNDLPFDPKPLFTSSIVIEEWGPAITTGGLGFLPIHLTLTCDQRNHGRKFPNCMPCG